MDTLQKDRKFLGREGSPLPLEFSKTENCFIFDTQGNKYVDFLMGWNVGNLGWGVKEIRDKIKKFSGPDYVDPYSLYKPWADLAGILAKITPGNLVKTFRATGGTEAIEIAMQAAMAHTGRIKFVSVEGAYHGHSIGAMGLGQNSFRKKYKNLLPNCYKIKPPLNTATAKTVEKILRNGDIAAYVSEPIVCNLGVVIPDREYYDIVIKACKKYGTVFVMDEVATGFGRTGKLFASEHYNLQPDIMCLGKAITGGYGALGATIMTEEIAKSMRFDFSFYSTFGWHPLNVEAAMANLNYLLKRKQNILDNTVIMSKYFEKRLRDMKFRHSPTVRIKGLAIGIEFKKGGYALEIVGRCFKNKLLLSTLGQNIFTIFPALTIDQKTAKEGLDILESCL